jgi:hypothetical protein
MKVFWSWQSDCPAEVSKEFVKGALADALTAVIENLSLSEAERPEVDHDTKGEPGLVDIAATVFRKIEGASAFVADVTPVARTGTGKLVPNPNVMIELGYALKALGPAAVVLVANEAFGAKAEELPFDLRHRRGPITYNLSPGAAPATIASERKSLADGLAEALRSCLAGVLVERDAASEFVLHAASPFNPALWHGAETGLTHQNYFQDGGADAHWRIVPGPVCYMRISPMGWTKGKISRRQVREAPDAVRLDPLGRWRHGDGGANAEGVLAVGFENGVVHAATQWFDKTGELWGFNSSMTSDLGGNQVLASHLVLRAWSVFLDRGLAFMDHCGGSAPYRVEAGMNGLDTVRWWDGRVRGQGLESSTCVERHGRDWTAAARLKFLAYAYNSLCDAFNEPRVDEDTVKKMLAD